MTAPLTSQLELNGLSPVIANPVNPACSLVPTVNVLVPAASAKTEVVPFRPLSERFIDHQVIRSQVDFYLCLDRNVTDELLPKKTQTVLSVLTEDPHLPVRQRTVSKAVFFIVEPDKEAHRTRTVLVASHPVQDIKLHVIGLHGLHPFRPAVLYRFASLNREHEVFAQPLFDYLLLA